MVTRDEGVLPVQPVQGNRLGMTALVAESQAAPASTIAARQPEAESREGGEPMAAQRRVEVSGVVRSRSQHPEAHLSFETDESTGKMVVRLQDPATGQVIRQIPPEDVLRIARSINQYLGLLVDRQS